MVHSGLNYSFQPQTLVFHFALFQVRERAEPTICTLSQNQQGIAPANAARKIKSHQIRKILFLPTSE